MRIEGTYTFPGTIDRVFAALGDPETLRGVLPGCERLIQLGPAETSGAAALELRLRPNADALPLTVAVTRITARQPTHLRLALHGHGGFGALRGKGTIDLVEQEAHTIGAYAWEIETPELAAEEQRAAQAAGARYARAVCERLSAALLAREEEARQQAREIVAVTTPRGRVVALREAVPAPAFAFDAGVWTQRTLWMGSGLLLGAGAIALALSVLHRLGEHEA